MRLKSPSTQLFAPQPVQANIEENIIGPHDQHFCERNLPVDGFPRERTSKAENVSIFGFRLWIEYIIYNAQYKQGCAL